MAAAYQEGEEGEICGWRGFRCFLRSDGAGERIGFLGGYYGG